MARGKAWTPAQDAKVSALYATTPPEQLRAAVNRLGPKRTLEAVIARAAVLGVRASSRPRREAKRGPPKWRANAAFGPPLKHDEASGATKADRERDDAFVRRLWRAQLQAVRAAKAEPVT